MYKYQLHVCRHCLPCSPNSINASVNRTNSLSQTCCLLPCQLYLPCVKTACRFCVVFAFPWFSVQQYDHRPDLRCQFCHILCYPKSSSRMHLENGSISVVWFIFNSMKILVKCSSIFLFCIAKKLFEPCKYAKNKWGKKETVWMECSKEPFPFDRANGNIKYKLNTL